METTISFNDVLSKIFHPKSGNALKPQTMVLNPQYDISLKTAL